MPRHAFPLALALSAVNAAGYFIELYSNCLSPLGDRPLAFPAWSSGQRFSHPIAPLFGRGVSFQANTSSAIARPLKILDTSLLHFPLIAMLGSLMLVIILASFRGYLGKTAGVILLAAYPLFLIILLVT
ncbi:MAG: hypothetical protein ACFE0J_00730 [Elainellaceae cyanobacterium]